MGCISTKVSAVVPQPADDRPAEDFFDKYELAVLLGQGSFGSVYKASSVECNEELAVKILDLGFGRKTPDQMIADANAELRTWVRVGGHPNVVGLRERCVDDKFVYFVMELANCSLLKAFEAEPDLNERIYARYFKEMSQALAHIHSVGVVHRDVKQDNFVVGGSDLRTVKLCDFGLSAAIEDEGEMRKIGIGSAPWMAPEMLIKSRARGTPADVWSFGVIVYTVLFGEFPYQPRIKAREEMMSVIREGKVTPTFASTRKTWRNAVSGAGTSFVEGLLDRDPFARPSAASCVEMMYVNQQCCNQLQANGTHRRISLWPQFRAAVDIGAFGVFDQRTPKVDERRERRLMRKQSKAQSRRTFQFKSRDETAMPEAHASNVAAGPMPSEPLFSDIRGPERSASAKDVF